MLCSIIQLFASCDARTYASSKAEDLQLLFMPYLYKISARRIRRGLRLSRVWKNANASKALDDGASKWTSETWTSDALTPERKKRRRKWNEKGKQPNRTRASQSQEKRKISRVPESNHTHGTYQEPVGSTPMYLYECPVHDLQSLRHWQSVVGRAGQSTSLSVAQILPDTRALLPSS